MHFANSDKPVKIYNLNVIIAVGYCYSCIKENDKKINYITYIKSRKNEECNKAICRMYHKIDIEGINSFIDKILYMSDVRKQFYKNMIKIRYDILKEVYHKLNKF